MDDLDQTAVGARLTTPISKECSFSEMKLQHDAACQAKADAIIALLAKLSLHYWRPDFTPSQAKQVYGDYLADIGEFPMKDIQHAIDSYRRNPESKFFPHPGALRGILETPPAWWVSTRHKWLKDCQTKAAAEIDAKVRQISAPKQAQITPA